MPSHGLRIAHVTVKLPWAGLLQLLAVLSWEATKMELRILSHAGDCAAPAYLANVCVAPAAHRQGIGRRLIENARALAMEWGER